MKQLLFAMILLAFASCADDSDCQTCISETSGGNVEVEYCQVGSDVESTTNGVLGTIPNTTVDAVVATQLALGNVNCN